MLTGTFRRGRESSTSVQVRAPCCTTGVCEETASCHFRLFRRLRDMTTTPPIVGEVVSSHFRCHPLTTAPRLLKNKTAFCSSRPSSLRLIHTNTSLELRQCRKRSGYVACELELSSKCCRSCAILRRRFERLRSLKAGELRRDSVGGTATASSPAQVED